MSRMCNLNLKGRSSLTERWAGGLARATMAPRFKFWVGGLTGQPHYRLYFEVSLPYQTAQFKRILDQQYLAVSVPITGCGCYGVTRHTFLEAVSGFGRTPLNHYVLFILGGKLSIVTHVLTPSNCILHSTVLVLKMIVLREWRVIGS